ncbi:MAG: amino acid ABC transporter ATP-binding protein, partial [Anaerotignum sp.]|nr:amino acid ABC transporter ATP-binding protein [Anaerotignum sp.]
MNANETLIKVENLQKYYKGGEIKALDGINTEIKKGEVVVVIGPSGSGKSTFLRCLNLLEVPTGGSIFFEDTDITDEKTNISEEIAIAIQPLYTVENSILNQQGITLIDADKQTHATSEYSDSKVKLYEFCFWKAGK